MTNLDIIVLLVVVVIIFQKLRNLLGTRPTGGEELSEEKAAEILNFLIKENRKIANEQKTAEEKNSLKEKEQLSETEAVLAQIPNFNPSRFEESAKKAFEIIITSFAKGDTEALEMLVSKNLFKKFQEIINQRQSDDITAETDLIGFSEVKIVNAKIVKNDTARISVEFHSEQVNLLRNAEGKVIEGDENYIQNITDVWTFEKSLTSSNPNWILVSTKK